MSLEVINSAAPEGKQKTIIVFGLGRGGTSALAGVLRLMGMAMPEDRTHPLKHEWSPIAYREGQVDRQRTREALEAMDSQFPVWGWKSPSDVFHVAQYLSFLRNPHFIIVFRNVYDVLLATRKYEGIELEAWMPDIVEVLRAISEFMKSTLSPTAIFSYDGMIADPQSAVMSISGWLGLDVGAEQANSCIHFLSGKHYKGLVEGSVIDQEEIERDSKSAKTRVYGRQIERPQEMLFEIETDIVSAKNILRKRQVNGTDTPELLESKYLEMRREYRERGTRRIDTKIIERALREKAVPAFRRLYLAGAFLSLSVVTAPSCAQEMLRGVDLAQPAYSQAELTREAIEAALKARKSGAPLDLSEKSLNGLDLSGLDLSNANLHAARLVKTRLVGAKLDHAILDQAWLLEADVSRASLVDAHLFSAQMQRIRADDADFSLARVTGDLTGASLRRAKFVEADLSSDIKNQSMGLMRVVLSTANAEEADFTAANLRYADLRFLRAARANFSGAALDDADASGADFTGAKWDGVKAMDLDLDQARIDESAKSALRDAKNLDRARTR